ncbi:NAD(P)-binding protein [Aspergillus germanicus]
MAVKIFITGATGYIGGDVFYLLQQNHPDAEFSLLIRSVEKAKAVLQKYPAVRTVVGSLDDSELIEREAAQADIVIHTADSSDHVGSATAIAKGLVRGHTREWPGFWLHTGGAGILTYFDSEMYKSFGELGEKVFNDYEGVNELVNLPSEAFHRNVDEIVLRTGIEHRESVRTAIIAPPTIYGVGRGPGSGRGRQVYELTSFILKEKYCPRIGKGLSRWNNIHVQDLSVIFDLLVGAALDKSRQDDSDIWGQNGYFLTEHGEHTWGDLAKVIGQEAVKQGFVKYQGDNPKVRDWSIDEAVNSPAGFEAASWGMNSRGQAVRARKVLGWVPKERSLEDEVPTIVRDEAASLEP